MPQAESAVDGATDVELTQADDEQNEGQVADGEVSAQADDASTAEAPAAAAEASEPAEVVVTIGEESPPPEDSENRAPDWVRDLRKSHREAQRKLAEAEAELQRLKGGNAPQDVGQKPTLAGCDYDDERFERELLAWNDRKAKAEQAQQAAARQQQEAQQQWQNTLNRYGKAKAELRVRDFDVAEMAVEQDLDRTQMGVILHSAKAPELVVYALGKSDAKRKEIAAIRDPLLFARAIWELESQVKVTQRTPAAPPPERVVKSTVAGAAAVDNTLERLREEALKSGDITKLNAYKRQLREKQRAA